MRRLLLAAAGLLSACLFESPDKVAGGGSETEYLTLTGRVTAPDGTPAANCKIAIRPASWLYDPELPRGPGVKDTVTDAKGGYAVKVLPKGDYLVEGVWHDSLAFAIRVSVDSARPDTSARIPRADGALAPTGTLTLGIADPKPGVDYFIQVYGLQRKVLADTQGNAKVTLPAGEFTARIISSPKETLPAEFMHIVIRSGADTSLPGVVLPSAKGQGGIPFIFDSNIGFAVDDAAALTMLHVLADKGEISLIATGTTNPSRTSDDVLDIINTWYGRGSIPVGSWKKEKPINRSGYDSALSVSGFAQDLPSWDSIPEAAAVYARALEGQPDSSVVIFCSGDVRNAWDLMLRSPALVKRKVKRLVLVGGKYPSGREFNFVASLARDSLPNMIKEVLDAWPGPIHFAGTETGEDMASCGCLATAAAGGPLKRIYDLGLGAPNAIRPSTDLAGALYAVRGVQSYWTTVTGGGYDISADGTSTWNTALTTGQVVLVRKGGPEGIAAALDSLICPLAKP